MGIEAWMHTDGRKKGMRKFTLIFLCKKKRNAKGMEGEGMMNDVDVTFLEQVFLSQPFRRRNRVARWQTSRAWT